MTAELSRACELLGVTAEDMLAHKLYDDRIVIVLTSGPKHTINLTDLPTPPPKPTRTKPATRKR